MSAAPKVPDAVPHDPAAEQAVLIMRDLWADLEREIGHAHLRFPKEIIWLNGAPGSGKGTNTPFIMRERDIEAAPIVTSSLLSTPEMQRLKDAGNLIDDRAVVGVLFRHLLRPEYRDGVVVDGFPRTRVQAECLKLVYQRMLELRREYASTPLVQHFPKPVFRIAILWVEERESIERQLKRGRQIIAHNQRVRDTGVGELLEERPTDVSEEAARKRYRIFKEQAQDVLLGLKKIFHYHLINAQGDIASVERLIINEFQYQSSLELEEETLDSINHIPLAATLVHNARQHLVRRLDGYQRDHGLLFRQVVAALETDLVPSIRQHAITGLAYIASENALFAQPQALAMAVDIFNERGYYAMVMTEYREVPVRFDTATGAITCERRPVFRFQIRFQGSVIRRGH